MELGYRHKQLHKNFTTAVMEATVLWNFPYILWLPCRRGMAVDEGFGFFFQKHLRSQAALTEQNRALVCWYLWVREAQTQHCVAYEWFTFVPLGSHLPLTPALEKVWNGNIVMSRNAWNKINRDPYSRKDQSCLVFIPWADGRLGNAKGRRKVWIS